MDFALFFINSFVFGILWLMGRACCAWLGRLAAACAGQSQRDVERHLDQMQAGAEPKEPLVTWLMRVSPRPRCTALLHTLFQLLTALPLVCLALGISLPFVPAWERYFRTAGFHMLVSFFGCMLVGFLVEDPLTHHWINQSQ